MSAETTASETTAPETTASPNGLTKPAGLPSVNTHRPAPPAHGLGRRLRVLVGVDEEILRWVPEERPRYTGLAMIVLNAGLLAAVSMLALLVKFVDAAWFLLLPVALLWGWVTVWIDRWLIISTHGARNGTTGVFVIRMALAVVIGIVVAEPLLLKIFEPAIHREVRADRVEERLTKESSLRACNPVPYEELDSNAQARCKANHLLLTVAATPAAQTEALRKTQERHTDLKTRIASGLRRIAAAESTVRKECVGDSGPGLSGRAGNGPYCKRAREVAERTRADSNLARLQSEAHGLERDMSRLTAKRQSAELVYEGQVREAITAKLPPVDGKVGILEEGDALNRLSGQSWFVLAAQILLRFMLVMLDCLPLLAKRLSGTTTYDQMFSRHLVTDEDLHTFDDGLKRQLHLAEKRLALKDSELDERRRLEALERQELAVHLQREAEISARIDARAEELRQRIKST